MINILDIETYEEEEHVFPYCICLLLNNKEISFYWNNEKKIIEEAIYYIFHNSLSNIIEIFVHNLNFDGILIIEYLSKSKILFEIKSLNINLYWIKIYYIDKIIIFRCSYKIIPLSLKKIGEIEKLEKTAFPYKFISKKNLFYIGETPKPEYWENNEFGNFKKKIFDVKKESIDYCLNDIRIIKKCLTNLIKIIKEIDNNLLSNCFSAPSISHKIFFKYYNYSKISQKIEKNVEIYVRKSYKGGRCEVFGNPNHNEIIKYYDFPGMYGLCMKEKFHNGRYKITTKANITDVGFHTITYESKNNNIPILPYHSEKGKLLFCNGINTDTFWFEEILYFLENGGIIIKKHHSLVYDEYCEVFNKFVNFFDDIRKKDGYYKIFGKLMINSLYGGMGMKEEEIYNYISFSDTEFEYISKNLNINKFYKINDIYIIMILNDYKFKKFLNKKTHEIEKSTRNVTYASAIASKARIKLHKFINKIEKDGGRILYTDTDSVFAAYPITDRREYINDDKWIEIYDDAVFASPKSYALKTKDKKIIRIKGISAKNIDFETFKKNFYNNKEYGFNYQKINAKRNFILNQKEISKNINFEKYDKRVFDKSKKNTTPLYIITPHSYNE